MSESRFVFRLTPYDVTTLLPQVRRALETRTELVSRQQYPTLWKHTDRLRARAKGRTRSPLRTGVMSVICLILGLILLIPGLMEPQELLVPLVAGGLAVGAGLGGLWSVFRRPKDPFDLPARKLLEGSETFTPGQVSVAFTREGIEIPDGEGGGRLVEYNEVETAVQTDDALLVVYGDRVMLLQLRDLAEGEIEDFQALLRQKIGEYHVLAGENTR